MTRFLDRQEEIITASINLISEKGIQELTIKNLSKTIGISEPAIYRYYDSKIDILLGLLSFFEQNMRATLERISSSKLSPLRQIETLFLDHFENFSKKPAMAAVIFSEEIFQNDERLSEKVYSIIQMNEEGIKRIIRNGQEQKEINDVIAERELAYLIMGTLRFVVKKWQLSKYSFNLLQEGTKLWNALKRLIKI